MSNPFASAVESGEVWKVSTGIVLPVGNWVVQIDRAEMSTSSGGHPQIELDLSSPDGSIRDWLITDGTAGPQKVGALIAAAGLEPPSDEQVRGYELAASYLRAFIGKKVGAVVREEEKYSDPGKKTKRVLGYLPPTSIKPLPGQGEARPDSGAGFDPTTGGFGSTDVPASSFDFPGTTTQPASAVMGDDDIPF
jgi:hypothetical protein